MNSFDHQCHKKKVVFIMGATGTGKSRLSIDLSSHFLFEVINSDKIQVYKGLDIVTNKIPSSERQAVPHHLLGCVNPNSDFTIDDFCNNVLSIMDLIVESGHLPIIVGGSNSYIEALVDDPSINFKSKYDCCFIWLDVDLSVLYSYVSKRVDYMVQAGLVEEVREIFVPGADYSRGIRQAIGVPEMDKYFQAEMKMDTKKTDLDFLLKASIDEIKVNTCDLVSRQVKKIQRLNNELGWFMHRIDATNIFEKHGDEADDAWEKHVKKPCFEIVGRFLEEN